MPYEKNGNKLKSIRYKRDKKKLKNAVLQRKFGITFEEYEEKLKLQNNQCYICKKSVEDNGKALAVDNATGKVRDLLCNNCNVVVGFLNEQIDLCDKVKKYIFRHKE